MAIFDFLVQVYVVGFVTTGCALSIRAAIDGWYECKRAIREGRANLGAAKQGLPDPYPLDRREAWGQLVRILTDFGRMGLWPMFLWRGR